MRMGIYRTEDGNAAYVSGPKARMAYDLDMAEAVPISYVTDQFVREAEPFDEAVADEAMERFGSELMGETDCSEEDL